MTDILHRKYIHSVKSPSLLNRVTWPAGDLSVPGLSLNLPHVSPHPLYNAGVRYYEKRSLTIRMKMELRCIEMYQLHNVNVAL